LAPDSTPSIRRLCEVRDHLTAAELQPGFVLLGAIPPINPQRGIFKPQQMR
jgi:putative restriction endonuclease